MEVSVNLINPPIAFLYRVVEGLLPPNATIRAVCYAPLRLARMKHFGHRQRNVEHQRFHPQLGQLGDSPLGPHQAAASQG